MKITFGCLAALAVGLTSGNYLSAWLGRGNYDVAFDHSVFELLALFCVAAAGCGGHIRDWFDRRVHMPPAV